MAVRSRLSPRADRIRAARYRGRRGGGLQHIATRRWGPSDARRTKHATRRRTSWSSAYRSLIFVTDLASIADGLDPVTEVCGPHPRLLYAMYHSSVLDEEPADVLASGSSWSASFRSRTRRANNRAGNAAIDWSRHGEVPPIDGYEA
jgi:hypothetical protein